MRTRCCLPIVIPGIAAAEYASLLHAADLMLSTPNPSLGLIHSLREMIYRWIQSQVAVQCGVEKVIGTNRGILHLLPTLYFSCNALFSLVIVAVLTLLDFLTFARASCYEFDPSHLKT
jgi:hypothetical protein